MITRSNQAFRLTNARLIAAAVVALGASGELASAQNAAAIGGCYEFDRAYFTWTTGAPAGAPPVQDSARLLRLLTTLGPPPNGGAGRNGARPSRPFNAESPGARSRYLSFWRFADSSAIVVSWGSPVHPLFQLAVLGDSLTGTVMYPADTISKSRIEPVSAVRIPCPSR